MSSTDSIIEKAKEYLKKNLVEIEKRDDLSQSQKSNRIIHLFSGVCAGIAIQPIPFADIFVLTPIQVLMGERLAAIWGVPVTESSISAVIKDILKIGGMGLLSQQLAIGAYKTFLPFMGAVTTVPLVYGLTYAIGTVLSEMYKRRSRGESKLSDEELRKIWNESRKKGKEKYKKGDEIDIK